MKVRDTRLPGVKVIEPRIFGDSRGFFLESFNANRFAESGLPTSFVQDNHSRSARGVLRGLHYQLRHPQGKLITVTNGEVFDVAVDIRRGSPSFGRSFATLLTGDEPRFLWIPPGFAHGFCVVSEIADFLYKCTDFYDPADDRGVLWSDPDLGIEWPTATPTLSEKDTHFQRLNEPRDDLPTYSP